MTIASPSWKRPFFTIWIGQAFSLMGSQLVQFALIWYLTDRTGSATTLATASLAGLLPQAFLSPFIGALVDRWSRRRIMIFADAGIAFATALLMLLFILNRVEVWHVYLILFIRAIGSGFHGPAMGASTALMVPKEHLTRIQGANQALFGGLNIVAAPLGALLLAVISMTGILLIDIVTATFAIAPLLFIDVPQPVRTQTAKSTLWQDMSEGLRYVVAWKGLMFILIMATLINFLLTPAFSLLPLLVRGHFGGGALELGWIESTSGIGVVVGGSLLGIWGGFRRRVATALVGLIGLGAGTVLVGVAPADAFWLGLVALFITGLMTPITNGSFGAIIQAAVAPEMHGRVFSLVLSAATAIAPLGLVIAGPAADALGVQSWFLISGIFCAAMGVVGFLIPAVIYIEDGGVNPADGEQQLQMGN